MCNLAKDKRLCGLSGAGCQWVDEAGRELAEAIRIVGRKMYFCVGEELGPNSGGEIVGRWWLVRGLCVGA